MLSIIVPLLSLLFKAQDFVRGLLRIEPAIPTEPPMLPGLRAVPDGGWGYLPSRRGELLFYRYWLPAGLEEPEALVIAVHGAGAHGGHLWILGKYLANKGIGAYVLDLRGHGYSEGPRGDLSQSDLVTEGIIDLARFLAGGCEKRRPYVIGESFGANLVMMAATKGERWISGIVLSGTPLEPTEEATGGQLLATILQYIRYLPYILFDSQARVVDITARAERVARDKEAVKRERSDPLRNNKLSIRTITETYRIIKRSYDIARKVRVPTLLLQGGHDLVTKPSAVWKLRDALGTDDVEVAVFPDAYHGLFFDPDTPKVLETLAAWLQRHTAGRGVITAESH